MKRTSPGKNFLSLLLLVFLVALWTSTVSGCPSKPLPPSPSNTGGQNKCTLVSPSIWDYIFGTAVYPKISCSPESPRKSPSPSDPTLTTCQNLRRDILNESTLARSRVKRWTHEEFQQGTCIDLFNLYDGLPFDGTMQHENHPINLVRYRQQNGWRLPVVVSAEIRAEHLQCNERPFGNEDRWNLQMQRMNARHVDNGWPHNDERGHIVAREYCGPRRWYNLAPQTPTLNRNVDNFAGWRDLELRIPQFFNRGCGQQVDWHVIMNYHQNFNAGQLRPRGFKVCVSFHWRDGTQDNLSFYFNNEHY